MKYEKKITLFVMNEKGLRVLEELIQSFGPEVIDLVICCEDKNVEKDYYEEIVANCELYNLNYYNRNDDYQVNTEYCIAVGWRWIINVHCKLIILHDSLLPRYRGFAPLVNCLINGEREIGVTALFATDEYDKGDIIVQKSVPIKYPLKIKDAIEIISNVYMDIVREVVNKITSGEVMQVRRQDEENASYSLWRDDDDYFINWSWNCDKIKRFIDAVGFPYNGARCYLNEEIIIIEDVEVLPNIKVENRDIGKVIFFKHNFPVIVGADGLILIKKGYYMNSKGAIFPFKKFRSRLY